MDSGQVQHASQACQRTTKAHHQSAQQGWGKSSCERARKYHVFLQEENMTRQTVLRSPLNWPVKASKLLHHFFVLFKSQLLQKLILFNACKSELV